MQYYCQSRANTLAKKKWDNRAHVAQARDLSSMHAPMFGLRGCFNFYGQGSGRELNTQNDVFGDFRLQVISEVWTKAH